MRAERGDPSVWKEVYEQGKKIAAEFEIEPSMARTTGKKEQSEGCNTRGMSQPQTQSPTGKEPCISLLLII